MYIKWTKEKCKEEALKYNYRNSFRNSNPSAHDAARRNKWMDEICSHMVKPYEKSIKWTKEKCQEEALKYNYRIEFINGNPTAYNVSLKNKWLDEICSHMLKKDNLMKRCIYVYEFSDNYAYVGLTYNLQNRHHRHINDVRSSVFIHMSETNLTPKLIQLTDYILAKDASKLESEYVDLYNKNNWIILNKSKAGGIGGNVIKWTKEKCKEEALKYNNIKDFFNNSKRAYIKSIKSKWLDDICDHMLINKMHISDKTKESCHAESLKYKSRYEFSKRSMAFYTFAKRHKWLDEICSHMIMKTKPQNYWTREKCYEFSLLCKNRKQFQKMYSGAYNAARKNNWLNDLFAKNPIK